MRKFAALFTAAVMVITIGACINGQTSTTDPSEPAAVTQSV